MSHAPPMAARTIMPDVPYEVWRHITDFLPLKEVKQMYGVNRSLFNIAMDERYRTARLDYLLQESTKRCLSRVVDPGIASRVRSFELRPGHLCKLLQEKKTESRQKKLANILRALVGLRTKEGILVTRARSSIEITHRNVIQIMQNLTSVTTLRVGLVPEEYLHFSHAGPSFFADGWRAFGRTLKELHLDVPLEALHIVLPKHGCKLTSLDTLVVRLFRVYHNLDDDDMINATLLPFINLHHEHLVSLSLESPESIRLSPLLRNLNPMPLLRSFRVQQSFVSLDQTDLTGLEQFLRVHRRQLQHLDIAILSRYTNYPAPNVFFSQPCFQVSFPALKELSIFLCHFPTSYTAGIIPHILQFKNTLTSLVITLYQRFSQEEFVLLVSGLAPSDILRELKMDLFAFGSQDICLLAKSFPKLETLTIQFIGFATNQAVGAWTGLAIFEIFCMEMRQLSFPQWKLRTLNIPSLALTSRDRQTCKAALLSALPNVMTVNGRGREEYLMFS
ncbi:hypothetical protein B0H34DRAFT_165958 [Crassisporium funariophilum]|nr:hypothetical protein B0H34DRAFT_165958 [Crassisporium funariophilum]